MSGAVEGVKIAACPFCGSTTGAEPIKDNRKLWSVRCGCGLHGTWNTRRYGAIDSWNDRAHRYRMVELKASLTTPPARSYADEDRVTIARALAERFIERGNARVTGSVHASWEAMPWSYRRDFLADADAVINVLSQGGKA